MSLPEVDQKVDSAVLTYREAIIAGLDHALRDDPEVLFLGEDIGAAGGLFKCSEGLLEKWGSERIIDTPISEFGFSEAALGMALVGMRPIIEIMFADFLGVAASPIAVDFPRYRLTSGGQAKVPIVIRTVGGLGWHFGAQHSMTYESWMQGMPGLSIAVSSSPASAYRNIRAAVESDNPVLIIEHKQLLQQKELVEFGVPATDEYFGKAQVMREGTDVTVVSSLSALATAREAAEMAQSDGVSVEVIDIAWVKPLDDETVRRSVEKTGRLVIFTEDYFEGSWAATLIARLATKGVQLSEPPLVRCLPTDVPIPFAKEVEMALLPDAQELRRDIVSLVSRQKKD